MPRPMRGIGNHPHEIEILECGNGLPIGAMCFLMEAPYLPLDSDAPVTSPKFTFDHSQISPLSLI